MHKYIERIAPDETGVNMNAMHRIHADVFLSPFCCIEWMNVNRIRLLQLLFLLLLQQMYAFVLRLSFQTFSIDELHETGHPIICTLGVDFE